ncbi:hypothetical protein BDV28DRAFT_149201 [Aspergillus coremiiformis]|uniref:Uncharacterized protein n=1 Tax=Aspergillus coremiiformis TaxID=138285 RepID=A0A5N6Z6I0_9EURO|nr:hypothetical protein BDV28DRAFT_149201 [Aspergillus coremiiformis]
MSSPAFNPDKHIPHLPGKERPVSEHNQSFNSPSTHRRGSISVVGTRKAQRRYSLQIPSSKLANILYARELARRYPAITTVSVHPGVVRTGLVENLGWANRWFIYTATIVQTMTLEEGTYNQLWAATTSKDRLETGQFYLPVGVPSNSDLNTTAQDGTLAGQLWEWMDKALEGY